MYGKPRFEFWHCPGQWRGYEKGGSSSSAATTNVTETIQMDNRMVNDRGAAVTATNSNVNQAIDVTNFSLDSQLASDAIGAFQRAAEGSMIAMGITSMAGTDAVTRAAGAALDFAGGANKGALDFAGGATKGALDFAGKNADGVFDFGKESSGMAYRTITDALGFAEKTLDLGAAFVRDNKDLIGKTQQSVGDAYKTASQVQNGQQVLIILGLVVAGIVAVKALK